MSIDSVSIEYNLVYQASATFAQPLTGLLRTTISAARDVYQPCKRGGNQPQRSSRCCQDTTQKLVRIYPTAWALPEAIEMAIQMDLYAEKQQRDMDGDLTRRS
jgi:hypothetical protein